MRRVRWLVVPLVMALSAPTFAQLTEKQALAQMKADLKAARKELKLAIGGAQQTFEGHLEQDVGLLTAGTSSVLEFALNVALHADDLQRDVRDAIVLAGERARDAATTALGELAAGQDLSLGYPAPFTMGSGSNLDAYEADVRKDVARVYAALSKRLKKTAKSAEAQGFGITWRLSPPVEFFAYEANPVGGTSDASMPLGIDVLVGASLLDQDDDGFLALAGTCNGDEVEVSLDIFATDIEESTISIGNIDEDPDRWNIGFFAAEGNYTLVVNQDGGGSFTGASFGIR